MDIKPGEITDILKREIREYDREIDVAETGTVLTSGDGIARVYGLDNALAGELLDFGDGLMGMVLNLEEDNVGVALMGEANKVREGDLVRMSDHSATLTKQAEVTAATILQEAESAGLEPPNPKDWASRLGVDLESFRNLVAHLERQDLLVRAPGDLWFAKQAIDDLIARVMDHFKSDAALDTQAYKILIGTSRRTAMPLMELLDDLHITRRQGEVRILRGQG